LGSSRTESADDIAIGNIVPLTTISVKITLTQTHWRNLLSWYWTKLNWSQVSLYLIQWWVKLRYLWSTFSTRRPLLHSWWTLNSMG